MKSKIKIAINILSLIGIAGTIFLCICFFRLEIFNNPEILKNILSEQVYLGPLIFIFLQLIQVVIPIIPGGASAAAGVLIFGPFWGFVYNYIGIILGSFLLFFLGRTYGKPFAQAFISEKTFNKYIGKLDDNKKWDTLFIILIFLPIAPDDALVLMSSLTKIKFRKFALIILLGKPFAIFIYSFGLVHLGQFLTNLLH